MTDKDTESRHQEDHLAARAEVIRQYGDLWRQAIAKIGIVHTATTDALLQLCAACNRMLTRALRTRHFDPSLV